MEETDAFSSSSTGSSTTPSLPTSVVGAPAHLRDAIRRAQNSAAARRSRARRKNRPPGDDVTRLEERIKQLEEVLAAAGYELPSENDDAQEQESHTSAADEAEGAETEQTEQEKTQTSRQDWNDCDEEQIMEEDPF